MQSLNILIAGNGKYVNQLKNSKYINKLFVSSEKEFDGVVQIKFNTFKELAQKCRALEIDIVLVEEEQWILEGIANVMKQYYVNCLALTSDWTELKLSHAFARKILEKYEINVPPIIKLPVEFPVIVKGDGVLKKANSMEEIINIKEKIYNTSGEISKNIFLEKYLKGEKLKITSIFDGKKLLTFTEQNINNNLLTEYSNKLEKMLLNENSKCMGFINSELIEADGLLYNTGFSFEFNIPDITTCKKTCCNDIVYICISAIYQKLNEIEFDI